MLLLPTLIPALLSRKTLEEQELDWLSRGAEVLEQNVPIYFNILCVVGSQPLQIMEVWQGDA